MAALKPLGFLAAGCLVFGYGAFANRMDSTPANITATVTGCRVTGHDRDMSVSADTRTSNDGQRTRTVRVHVSVTDDRRQVADILSIAWSLRPGQVAAATDMAIPDRPVRGHVRCHVADIDWSGGHR